MPSFETVDSLEIPASAKSLFDIVLDYPRMHEWYPRCRVELTGGGEVVEGSRLHHTLSPAGSPVKSRFTRTILRIEPANTIEESYDGGDLVGRGQWKFEPVSADSADLTRVSFHCQVRSNSWLMHIGFWVGGEKGHNMVYQEILAALKTRAASPSS